MRRNEQERIAELSALSIADAAEFQDELCYIKKVMSDIPESSGTCCEEGISAGALRCDNVCRYAEEGLFNNAPHKRGEFIITKKTVGV